MKNLKRALVGWTVFFWFAYGLGFLFSEGEPVCEGPLILGVNHSMPPQCADPIESIDEFARPWLVVLIIIGVVGLSVIAANRLILRRKTTTPAQSSD